MTKNFTYRPSPTALLDPCRDSIFKKLFTDNSPEGNKALQSFLEAVLGKSVSNIVLQPTELPIEDAFDKQARFDLNCKIDNSEYANIEIQGINTEKSFEKRAKYYCAHLLNHNVTSGSKWQEVPKVEELVNKIEAEQITIEDLTDTQKWSISILYASKEEHNNITKKISNSEGGIMCAVQILDKISQDEIEIAKKSLEKNLPLETISEITGLSIKEIQNLNR